jgi:hypothetical protein
MCIGSAWTMDPAPPVIEKADAAFPTYSPRRATKYRSTSVPSETLSAQQLFFWETEMLEVRCSITHSLIAITLEVAERCGEV